MFCALFWRRIRKNVHFEYIYLFTLHQHTVTINNTIRQHPRYTTSTNQTLKDWIYQGLADICEGDRESDLNCLD